MILDDFKHQINLAIGSEVTVIETRIRLLLRPRPRWLPNRLWMKLVGRMILVEKHQPNSFRVNPDRV